MKDYRHAHFSLDADDTDDARKGHPCHWHSIGLCVGELTRIHIT